MFIIEVIPIAKSIGTESLSYFTSHDVTLGAIVSVPLRNKIVQGIVISIRPAENMKSEIKNASFTLKKLDKIRSTEFFSDSFMDMAREASEYYATSVGNVLDILAPDYILKNVGKLKIENNSISKTVPVSQISTLEEKYAIQGDDDERYGTWKSLIRQEFAMKHSLFFLYPTVEDAEYAFSLLEKGIEGYAFLLHGSLNQKKIVSTWNAIMKEPHPVVIIATGGFLSIPREDVKTIIIEHESSRSYKILRRPFIDIRHVTEVLARKRGLKLFYSDCLLRLETLYRQSEGELIEASPFKFRSLSTAKDTLVDMRQYKHQAGEGFRVLSDEALELIHRTKTESQHMIILATRRGLAPTTVCGDCQNIVLCNNCSSPVVLHSTFFLCHRCGERRSTEEYCKTCGSWKLGAMGIGIDLVEKTIREQFPEVSLFRIDSDTISKQIIGNDAIHDVIRKFRSKPGSILLGTEMMMSYIHDKVDNSVIISLDSLFSLPDFRIQERILSTLVRMRAQTTVDFVVQTRKADEKVFEYGLKGNMSDFYRASIDEREQFNYPPFTMLVKLTLEGKKDLIVKEMEQAQILLEPYEVEVFPAFTHTVKGNYVLHGLIRIPKERWVDMHLIEKLRNLSPMITVKVDPETLL